MRQKRRRWKRFRLDPVLALVVLIFWAWAYASGAGIVTPTDAQVLDATSAAHLTEVQLGGVVMNACVGPPVEGEQPAGGIKPPPPPPPGVPGMPVGPLPAMAQVYHLPGRRFEGTLPGGGVVRGVVCCRGGPNCLIYY